MINAISMSTKVEDMIPDKNLEGFIHSVFDYAFNIQLPNNDLVGVISSKYNDNPYSITIDLKNGQTIDSLSVKQGMKVIVNKKSIRSLTGGLYINLQNTKSWEPAFPQRIKQIVDKSQLKINIHRIAEILIHHGRFHGIGPVIFESPDINENIIHRDYIDIQPNHYSTFILPRIEELLYALEQEDGTLTKKMLGRIVGFGPGLTPSADDMLVGIVAAMHSLAKYLHKDITLISYLQEGLDQECISQTTVVSQQMLKAAANGEFSETINELCIACISSTKKEDIQEKVLKVIDLGSTSGTDTIVGFLIGYHIVNKKYL